jgi:hypothetical protein
MFGNKHLIVAMIVAPVLALLAWFAVGQFAGERPSRAVPGQTYPLVEQSNCRWASGACDLENEEFRLRLTADAAGSQWLLTASHPLQGAVLAVALPDARAEPGQMQAAGREGLEWRLAMARTPGADERIRLVVQAAGSTYFADAATVFLQPKQP